MTAHAAADTEIIGVHHGAVMLDLLAFDAHVGDPVLAAAIGAAGYGELQLLIELRQPNLHLLHQPPRKSFRLGNCQLAELGPGASNGATPEVGSVNSQVNSGKSCDQRVYITARDMHQK